MTLLATLSNLGAMYPSTLGMYLINWLTVKNCSFENYTQNASNSTFEASYNYTYNGGYNQTDLKQMFHLKNGVTIGDYENKCSTNGLKDECIELGGECVVVIDAYYYLIGVFSVIGIVWILCVMRLVRNLNYLPKSEWKMKTK